MYLIAIDNLEMKNTKIKTLHLLPIATKTASQLVKNCKNVQDFFYLWKARKFNVISEVFGRLVGFTIGRKLILRFIACI